jgi:hypothetical protein
LNLIKKLNINLIPWTENSTIAMIHCAYLSNYRCSTIFLFLGDWEAIKEIPKYTKSITQKDIWQSSEYFLSFLNTVDTQYLLYRTHKNRAISMNLSKFPLVFPTNHRFTLIQSNKIKTRIFQLFTRKYPSLLPRTQ